jgi:hypothetical protein
MVSKMPVTLQFNRSIGRSALFAQEIGNQNEIRRKEKAYEAGQPGN